MQKENNNVQPIFLHAEWIVKSNNSIINQVWKLGMISSSSWPGVSMTPETQNEGHCIDHDWSPKHNNWHTLGGKILGSLGLREWNIIQSTWHKPILCKKIFSCRKNDSIQIFHQFSYHLMVVNLNWRQKNIDLLNSQWEGEVFEVGAWFEEVIEICL